MAIKNDRPSWIGQDGIDTLSRGYLQDGESILQMYKRVARAAASYYENSSYWEDRFFDVMWKGWLCASSPIISNLGTERGLPISCNSIHVDDSVDDIFKKSHELAILSKNGAGVGIYLGDIRGRGAPIKGNGKSEGIVPWCKLYDQSCVSVNQGSTRRGAAALYLPIEHLDAEEFLDIRKPTGDVNRRCLNLNHAICISNKWMEEMLGGDKDKRKIWQKILENRVLSGEPYIFFSDNVNDQNPECYKANNLTVKTSNICSEAIMFTDKDHTFVCCLASLNLAKYDEWKDSDLPQVAVRFLDAVTSEYIKKGKSVPGLENAIRSAEKGRSIGIGVLGWHSLLQQNMIPFDSFEAMRLNAEIFRTIRNKAEIETKRLAEELGEPLWCKGFNRRNSHLLAVAPTVSNSTIVGGVSPGIEPWAANYFSQRSAKGTFIKKNIELEKYLNSINKNDDNVWKSINENDGSVQHLSFLGDDIKQVFLTAREINQHAIIKQAAQRQKWIDQAQSINLFFGKNADPKYIHETHVEAYRSGIKTLYYLRSEGVLKSDLAFRGKDECLACEG